MLPPGLYEQVINTALNRELSEIPDTRKSVAPIDRAEASKVLAQYLADVVQKGLENVADNGGGISTQIGLANQIVNLIQNTTKEADFAALHIDQRTELLLALLRQQDPRLAAGKTAGDGGADRKLDSAKRRRLDVYERTGRSRIERIRPIGICTCGHSTIGIPEQVYPLPMV